MAALECSPEQALTRMAAHVQTAQIDRADYARLFESAARSDRVGACKRYIDAIEVLIRQKVSPEAEIRRVYEALSGFTAPKATLEIILSDITDQSHLARVLRRQACRLLVQDANASVPLAALNDIALCGDTGRLTAIDFLVTRRRPVVKQAQLLVKLVNEMSSQKIIVDNRRRCDYILRVLKLTNTFDQLCSELPEPLRPESKRAAVIPAAPATPTSPECTSPIDLIVSNADIKKNVPRLQALPPAEMAQWLTRLHAASTDQNRIQTDKSRYVTSNILSNLARSFQSHAVVVQILATALDLEAMAAEPSEYVFDKLQRICVAGVKYGKPAFAALARGLSLCAKRAELHPGETGPDGYDARLTGAARLVDKLSDWESLADAVVDLRDCDESSYVAYLLVVFSRSAASSTSMPRGDGAGRRRGIERLMCLALQSPLRSKTQRVRLHEVYALHYGACFDEQELSSYHNDHQLDIHVRMLTVAICALAASSAADAYKRCSKMASLLSDPKTYANCRIDFFDRLLQQHAFIDLAEQLGISLALHEEDDSLLGSEVAAVLLAARRHMSPLQAINTAYQAFRILRNVGDHFGAYCALQTALIRAQELFGETGVRFRAYRYALRCFMLDELQLPESMVQTAVDDKFGQSEPLGDGLDEIVESISTTVLAKPNAEALAQFEKEFEHLYDAMYADPMLGSATESVMAVPSLAAYRGRLKLTGERKTAQARLSSLARLTAGMSGLDWIDELRISEKMLPLTCIAASLRASPATVKRLDPYAAEKTQGKPIQAMREYLSQQSGAGASFKNSQLTKVPGNVICLSLRFDAAHSLVITRREQGADVVTVRLPVTRAGLRTSDKQIVTYASVTAEIKSIVEEAGSIEVSEDTSSERERFWKLQYALDDRMQKAVLSVQRSWIGGFGTLFSPRPRALEVGCELLDGLRSSVRAHFPTLRPDDIVLSPALGACIRDASLRDSFDQLQDLLCALFDNLVVQGASISVDELDLQALMADVRAQVRKFAAPKAEREAAAKHIVLVCDRKASVIPWEMLPVLQGCSVTRALSLNQVDEWAKQREVETLKQNDRVTVVLNPHGNLPRTQEKFDTEFRLRGWRGFIGTAPTREQFVDAFVKSSSLVYVGHGSGSMLAEPVAIRRLFLTQTAVYLFGCSSVAIQYPLFNKDIVTSYAVAGSRIIMGTLWNVKDKDCNRFTAEFLSRVFDDNEHVGKALWEARKACMLPYLTSAAWVLYGLP